MRTLMMKWRSAAALAVLVALATPCLAQSTSHPFDFARPFTVTYSKLVFTNTSGWLTATLSYRTARGDSGTMLWKVSTTSQRLEFRPNGVFLFAIDIAGTTTPRAELPRVAANLKQAPQLFYVFPQLQQIARARGLTLVVPQGPGRPQAECTQSDQDAAQQAFGDCVIQCDPGTVVPDGAGASCQTCLRDHELFGAPCQWRSCNDCCGDAFPGCDPPGGGGGGFGLACDINDPYCNTLKAYFGLD